VLCDTLHAIMMLSRTGSQARAPLLHRAGHLHRVGRSPHDAPTHRTPCHQLPHTRWCWRSEKCHTTSGLPVQCPRWGVGRPPVATPHITLPRLPHAAILPQIVDVLPRSSCPCWNPLHVQLHFAGRAGTLAPTAASCTSRSSVCALGAATYTFSRGQHDLVVIGGGPGGAIHPSIVSLSFGAWPDRAAARVRYAGYVAAIKAAQLGLKVSCASLPFLVHLCTATYAQRRHV
jgi:hypothetical protein